MIQSIRADALIEPRQEIRSPAGDPFTDAEGESNGR